eukprot:scaffold657_cov108-Cylindrotheca_fusiformis.AAC.6
MKISPVNVVDDRYWVVAHSRTQQEQVIQTSGQSGDVKKCAGSRKCRTFTVQGKKRKPQKWTASLSSNAVVANI